MKTARKENIACHVPKELSSEWRKMDATLFLHPLYFHFLKSGSSDKILDRVFTHCKIYETAVAANDVS